MGLLTFPPDNKPGIADASVWINIAASQHAAPILKALPYRLLITDVAMSELERGRHTGRTTIGVVEALVGAGLVTQVSCPEAADEIYLDLIGGSAIETLDDGEACTLAYAYHTDAVALIDERKATAVASRRFPSLPILATADIMLSDHVIGALGASLAVEALFNALLQARMRVPLRCLEDVYQALGDERAGQCTCLPQKSRAIR
jgi:predicted nucleic acid-binding protein